MVNGMAATTKITITLPDRQLEEIRKRVAAQHSPTVSGFIQQAVQKSLENAAEFRAIGGRVPKGNRRAAHAEGTCVGAKDAFGTKAQDQARAGRVNGIVFDAGGLIALERNDRRVLLILNAALEDGERIRVPATALAQVIRNPARQVRLWRMIQFDKTEVVSLDGAHAQAVGAARANGHFRHHRCPCHSMRADGRLCGNHERPARS